MNYQLSGLDAQPFEALFGASDKELADRGVKRLIADVAPGYPCRVSLEDAVVGEAVLLLNFEHQRCLSPYRSSHAIFVREGARASSIPQNTIPTSIQLRLLSVRAFDKQDMMVDADVVKGRLVESVISTFLANSKVSYLHLHNAKPGCYAARVDRA